MILLNDFKKQYAQLKVEVDSAVARVIESGWYILGKACYHLFVIKSRFRDQLLTFLHSHGIQALIHYPVPVNRQKAFPWQKDEQFTGTEQLAATVLSIPVYPELSDEDAENIITILHAFKQ